MSLKLQGLSHRFGSHQAIEDVNLTVQPGDCYGFIGHNGAGKTTTLRIAMGLLTPQQGRVLVDGIDAIREPRKARTLISGLGETPRFYDHLSGTRNLRGLGRLQGLSGRALATDVERVLSLVGLTASAQRPFGAYSQGMRQRLGIAQALLGSPRYVILDEPSNGLDPEGIAEMRELFVNLTHEGTAVLLSTHQLHEVGGVCNRVSVIRQGRVLIEDTTESLLRSGSDVCLISTDDDARALSILKNAGFDAERAMNGVSATIPEGGSGRLNSALVSGGLDVRSLGTHQRSLEEIYLRYTKDGDGQPASPTATITPSETDDVAIVTPPSLPGLRAARHELALLTTRLRVPLLLLLPAGMATLSIYTDLVSQQEATEASVAAGAQFGATNITAFRAVAWGLRAALPILTLVLAGLASQVIAGERSGGTLRHLVTRPLLRRQLLAGKTLTTLLMGLIGYGLLFVTCAVVAGHFFKYEGVADVLDNGMRYEHVPESELWPVFWKTLWIPILPILSYCCLGILISTLTRRAITALASTLGVVFLVDFLRAFARNFDARRDAADRIQHWLPSSHLPTFLSDRSFIDYFDGVAGGANDAIVRFQENTWTLVPDLIVLPPEVYVPLVWCIVCLGLAMVFFHRKSIA